MELVMYRHLKEAACRSNSPVMLLPERTTLAGCSGLCSDVPGGLLRCMTSVHKYRRDLNPTTAEPTRRACVQSRLRSSLRSLIILNHGGFLMANIQVRGFLPFLQEGVSTPCSR